MVQQSHTWVYILSREKHGLKGYMFYNVLQCYLWKPSLASNLNVRWIDFLKITTKENQSWVFIGRTDAKAETPILWPLHAQSWLTGKDTDAGRNWGQEEKGITKDEMAGWHHRLDRHEFEWTPGVSDGQGDLAYCDSWSRKESDTTEWLNWTEQIHI